MIERLKPYLPVQNTLVSITEVGSGMWNMREISSDYDIFVVYAEKSSDILAGRPYHPNLPCNHHIMIDRLEHDISYMEIGHLVKLLKRGNINAIWATLSPIHIHSTPVHAALAEFVMAHPSKSIFPSLKGITESQIADSTKRGISGLLKKACSLP